MPICITGMHRSGTSLVARLLHECGLYLGPSGDLLPAVTKDNENGYWENDRFVSLNDQVLAKFGGGWAFPPKCDEAWEEDLRLDALRLEAETLVGDFVAHEPWGWKDPRNCLTLPFWSRLNGIALRGWENISPALKAVLCVRNPFEVALSLERRNYVFPLDPLQLWQDYNQSFLDAILPENRIVTHYEAYFDDPVFELRRVVNFLDLPSNDAQIEQACGAVSATLRHQTVSSETAANNGEHSELHDLYRDLCEEARYFHKFL